MIVVYAGWPDDGTAKRRASEGTEDHHSNFNQMRPPEYGYRPSGYIWKSVVGDDGLYEFPNF